MNEMNEMNNKNEIMSAIKEFVDFLYKRFHSKNSKPLDLYHGIISRVDECSQKIKDNLELSFREFLTNNKKDLLYTNSFAVLYGDKIVYPKEDKNYVEISLDIFYFYNESNKNNKILICKHLIGISNLLFPDDIDKIQPIEKVDTNITKLEDIKLCTDSKGNDITVKDINVNPLDLPNLLSSLLEHPTLKGMIPEKSKNLIKKITSGKNIKNISHKQLNKAIMEIASETTKKLVSNVDVNDYNSSESDDDEKTPDEKEYEKYMRNAKIEFELKKQQEKRDSK